MPSGGWQSLIVLSLPVFSMLLKIRSYNNIFYDITYNDFYNDNTYNT
jgi:hypothetical protein